MGLGSEIWDPGSEIWDPRSGIRDPRCRVRDPGSEIRDRRSEIRDPRSEIRDPRSGIRDPGSKIQELRSGILKKPILDPRVKKVPDPGSATLQKLFDLPNVLAAVVDRLVGGDGNGEELPGELQHRLVLKDDSPATQARPLQPQPVLAVRIVTRRNLKQR
jgi:hypothetical protein